MSSFPAPALNAGSLLFVLPLLLLAPLAVAGLTLVNAGLGRSRSAAQSVLGSVVLV